MIDIAILTLLMLLATALLVFAGVRFSSRTDAAAGELVTRINRLLPQTQCAQCGYPGCRPYAEAIADGEAINRCPPGGQDTISALADLLGRPVQPLDDSCGESQPAQVAIIREEECIGCTLCIQACPVDAIIGAPQLMHTVISEACTGCDLCRPPCPVDCIDLPGIEQSDAPTQFPASPLACINCGECSAACPRDLQPQLLHWYRKDVDRGEMLRLDACIECGRCDAVCPSDIPLTQTFRIMKTRQRHRDAAARQAAAAESRFNARQARLIASTAKVAGRPSAGERDRLLDVLKDSS